MKKKIVLVGACDSIGVPYTKDNTHNQGFFEMIEEYLSTKYEVMTINCFHMSTFNDNKYIDYLITNEVSLYDIKNSQNAMLKKCKYSGIYPYLELPKKYLNHYKINDNDKNICVKNAIQDNNTFFIYSAFINDLLKSQKLSLFKLLRPGKIKKELKNVNYDNILIKLEENIQKLIKLNPNIKIFIVGLFVPTKIKFIRNNLEIFINSVNLQMKNILSKYPNVIFVNNTLESSHFNNVDFHPNKKGHDKIYRNFIEALEKYL